MLRKSLTITFWVVSSALLFLTLFGYLAGWFALAEFAVSLRPHYLSFAAVAFCIGLLSKQRMPLVLLLGSVYLNGIQIAPYYVPQQIIKFSNTTLLVYNIDKIRMTQVGVEEVVELIAQANADVVVLREVGSKPADELLDRFSADYAYSFAYQHEERDGVLILSRYAISNAEIVDMGDWDTVALFMLVRK
ncbi:MAG: endonuclease/exonuclease/phosphatase family protein [Chloroflexota bacterium]